MHPRAFVVTRYLVAVVLLAYLAPMEGCGRGEAARSATIRSALNCAGFEYVGQAADIPTQTVAEHASQPADFPSQLVKGRQYIFHRKQDARLSWVAVQECLSDRGATITDAPKGNVGLSYTYLDGPMYLIQFRLGTAGYTFQNSVARELESGRLKTGFEQQDFVLRRE